MNDTKRIRDYLTTNTRPTKAAFLVAMTAGIDWFIPSRIRDGDVDLFRRARLVVAFNLTLIVTAVIYAEIYFSAGLMFGLTTFLVGIGMGVACLCVMRLTGSCFVSGNLLTAAFFAVITTMSCRLGGFGAPTLPWYAAVPVVALSMAGRRSAFAWLAVTVSSLLAFFVLDYSGYSFPLDATSHQYLQLRMLHLVGLVVLMLGLALLYETAKDQTLAKLGSTKESLLREKRFSDSLIASLPGIFYLFDCEGRFLRWNENFEQVSGYSSAELSRMQPLDFFRGWEREIIAKGIDEVFTNGHVTLESNLITKDGRAIPYMFTSNRILLDGKPHLAGLGIDVTERKRVGESLRKSEERFRRFAEASGHGFAMGELNGKLFFANDATLRILEEESEENFTKKTFYQYYTPENAEHLRQEILPRVLKKGHWVGEIPLLSAKGHEITTEQNIFLVRDEHGEPNMVGNIITDITERKRYQAELAKAKNEAEAANNAKSEFLANMSHEIRTPMTAILGFSDLLMGTLTDQDQIDAAVTIKQNGNYLLKIINDILDLSKIEAGKLDVEHIECSPCRILSDVVSLMRVRADCKNLPLEIEYEGPIPQSIQSDPTQLRQILINLTGNAVKFTEVGKVRLVAQLLDADGHKPKMQFEVIDTGIGMTEGQIARLFNPFHQADTSTTRKFGGTGLGLTISKRLAGKLGGDIAVKSTIGRGSTFTLTVETGPLDGVKMLDNPSEAYLPVGLENKPPAALHELNCRILLAEDGPDNQRLITFLLEKAGAKVYIAENGRIACDLALAAKNKGTPFDVILMDMQMPVMDGYKATAALRKTGYNYPIIALTAHAMITDRKKCLDAGCDEYLAKPIDHENMISLVAECVARRRGKRVKNPT